MIQFYPAHAVESLEFNKICGLLRYKCRTDAARENVENIRFNIRPEYMERDLLQANEFKHILLANDYFPNDFTQNMHKELKLLSISNSVLTGEQFISVLHLALNIKDILQWFKKNDTLFPNLQAISKNIIYEKKNTRINNNSHR